MSSRLPPPSFDFDPPNEPPLVTVAVLPGPAARRARIRDGLIETGHVVLPDLPLAAQRDDQATVYRAIPTASLPAQVGQHVAQHNATNTELVDIALRFARVFDYGNLGQACSYQPVWDVARLDALRLELYVADDDDATQQLHTLADVLHVPRENINIKPRAGWQHYGWP